MRSSKKNSATNAILIGLFILLIPVLMALGYGIYNKVVKKATVISDYTFITKSLLGMEKRKDFLILFMNNAEARYGGGFIGSVGYVSVSQGKIKIGRAHV